MIETLINALVRGNFDRQFDAVSALSFYGTNAQPAIPVLLTLREPRLKSMIAKALKEIDPDGKFVAAP